MAQGKEFKATDKDRELVSNLVLAGVSHEIIARILKISENTLKKHFKPELEDTMSQRKAAIAGKCYQQAMAGDTALLIFLAKTQLRWSDKSDNDNNTITLPRIQVEILPKSKVNNDDAGNKKDS